MSGVLALRVRASLLLPPLLVAVVVCGSAIVVASASAAAISVNTESDSVATNDGACSLREAIAAANFDTASGATAGECAAGSGADSISLPGGVFTITRTGVDSGAYGDFDIDHDLTIVGAGAGLTTVSGGQRDRVFEVFAPATVRLQSMTITGGHAQDGSDGPSFETAGPSTIFGGSGNPGADGGGILNHSDLTLAQMRVTANAAGSGGNGGGATGDEAASETTGVKAVGGLGATGGAGGGIFNAAGTLTLLDSVIAGNSAGPGGHGGQASGGRGGAGTAAGTGGAAVGGAGGAGGSGGGIGGNGSVTVIGSTVSGNIAGNGGAGGQAGGGTGGNSAAWSGGYGGRADGGAGNAGGSGGGIDLSGAITISDSDIRGNVAGDAGPGGNGYGGHGGNGSGGNYIGGAGGLAYAGGPGAGGDGGGIDGLAAISVTRSSVLANHSGTGALGASAVGGTGGNGSGTGAGGGGNSASAADGGAGGRGGGIASKAGVAGPVVVDSTIAGNSAGAGRRGGDATGGAGGNGGGAFGNGGYGGNGYGGNGGAAGTGGTIFAVANASLTRVTATDNGGAAAGGAGGGTGGSAGFGGFPTPGNGFAGVSGGAAGIGGVVAPGGALTGSILAANSGNCGTALANGGHNIVFGDATCPGASVDPLLGALGNHGGPGDTRSPQPGSPAINAIATGDVGCGTTDERSVPRPQLGACDIGAYEVAPPMAATGSANDVASAGATLTGTVNRNAQAATFHFDYGATTDYGSSTAETAGDGPVSAAAAGLPAATVIHYRLVATNADGTSRGGDRTFTTLPAPSGAGGGSPPDVVAPVLSRVSLSRTRFAVGARRTALSAATRPVARGTVFRYTLSEAASVRTAIEQARPGRRVGKRCVKPTRKLRSAKPCTRWGTAGTLVRASSAAANHVPFSGRLGSHRLAPGRYRAVLRALDAAGNRSNLVRRSFSILKG